MIKSILLCSLLAIKLATPGEFIDETEMDILQSDIDDSSYIGSITELLKNIFKVENEPEEIDMADDNYEKMPMLLAITKKVENKYKNVVVYNGRFDNQKCRLVIPYNGFSSLSVIDGELVNIGNSSVTGRILYGDDEIDTNVYDTYSYILNPVYNSSSNVYRYGSYNYRRHYYVQNAGISYSDLYGKFYVDDVHIYYSDSQRTYYGLLAVLCMLGILFIRGRR